MVKKQKRKKRSEKGENKKMEDWAIEITQTRSDIKSFLEKFKADVARKSKEYQEYAQQSSKKKKS